MFHPFESGTENESFPHQHPFELINSLLLLADNLHIDKISFHMILTIEQQEVIDEFIREAEKRLNSKREGKQMTAWSISEYSKRMLYNRNHGKEMAKELLINYLLHIKKVNSDDPRIRLLESVIPKTGIHTWLLQSEYEREYGRIVASDVYYDGFGFVKLKGGIRVDDNGDLYREERLKFNKRKANLN